MKLYKIENGTYIDLESIIAIGEIYFSRLPNNKYLINEFYMFNVYCKLHEKPIIIINRDEYEDGFNNIQKWRFNLMEKVSDLEKGII